MRKLVRTFPRFVERQNADQKNHLPLVFDECGKQGFRTLIINYQLSIFNYQSLLMKYVGLTLCAIAAGMLLSSCGDSSVVVVKRQQYVAPADMTAENWADKVKDAFDLELSAPDGWKFSTGIGYATSISYRVEFTTEEEDMAEAVGVFYRHMFAETEKASSEGNFSFNPGKWEIIEKYAEITPLGVEFFYNPPVWYIKTSKGFIQFAPLFNKETKAVKLQMDYLDESKFKRK